MNHPIQDFLYHRLILFRLLLMLLSGTILSGCATPATYVGMVPTSYEIVKKHQNTVSVNVTGGSETSLIWKTQISDEAFLQALVEAIKRSQTFTSVVQGNGADYLLTITLFNMEQPSFGFSLMVKMEVIWTLKRTNDGATVWRESVLSEYTATMNDAFAAATRLRLATEGAARNNIAQGLAKISKLNL